MGYHKVQKQVLEILLNQYERSKTYQGENRVIQNFQISPEKVFQDYVSDYADMDQIRDFENQMEELEQKGLIVIKYGDGEIKKLMANPDRWASYYEILQRQEKALLQQSQIKLYQQYLGAIPLLDPWIREQIASLQTNKKAAYEGDDAENILKLCKFILHNHQDILERELSVAVLGDSKQWEKKYRSRVCRLLRSYGDYESLLFGISDAPDKEDKREAERILLAEHQVYSNPSYVYFKGNAEFYFYNGRRVEADASMPMAFSSETLKNLKTLKILDKKVITVENLTSFHRMHRNQAFFIFLSGYHNSVKQRLIKQIAGDNPGRMWYHFGDIDPDGFFTFSLIFLGRHPGCMVY